MKFKIYLINLALVFSISLGLLTTTHANAQDSNTRALSCNNCSDAQKQQQVQQLVDSGYPQGQYRFVVVDMEVGNVREYNVNVPYQDLNEFGQWSQPATVSMIYRADQAYRNQAVKDVRDAVKDIEQAIDEALGFSIHIPESSGFTSAYHALQHKSSFGSYTKVYLANSTRISGKIREGSLKFILMTESLQIGASSGVGGSFSLTLNTPKLAKVTFADGSSIEIMLKLVHMIGEGLQIIVTTTETAYDKNGNQLPLVDLQLPNYNYSQSGINHNAFQRYFTSLGVKIVYSYGSLSGSGGSCETKWKCSADGKTCTLEVISTNC